MKISVLDYIDEAASLLEFRRVEFKKGAKKVVAFLEKILQQSQNEININYRIKTSDSLREKILRNDLYKVHKKENLFDNLSDIIGIRIGCRFLADEKTLFEKIKNHFCLSSDNIFFQSKDDDEIFLKLNSAQPEVQKNGFEIYRIDGYVVCEKTKLRFELQLKSLVNEFWSEIEHKIIYKNKRHMIVDAVFAELMNSIYDNLVNIDKQLNMLFSVSQERANTEFIEQAEDLLIVIINEVFAKLVERRTGISLNFREYSQSLVHFIVDYSSFKNTENDRKLNEDVSYGSIIMNIIRRLKDIDIKNVVVGEKIKFQTKPKYSNDVQKKIGEKLISAINSDFYINVFFHILFGLETGNDSSDFLQFVEYYEMRISNNYKVTNEEVLLKVLSEVRTDEMLFEETIKKIVTLVIAGGQN